MLAYALSVLHGQNNNPTPFERLLRRDRTIVSIALLGGYSSMDIPHNTTWEIKKATRAE
jgi:hypothetical protein